METAQSTVTRWTAESELGINPEKKPSRTIPKLHQTRLTLSNQAKNLGVILDKKLYWTDNIIDRTRKATIALFANSWMTSTGNASLLCFWIRLITMLLPNKSSNAKRRKERTMCLLVLNSELTILQHVYRQ